MRAHRSAATICRAHKSSTDHIDRDLQLLALLLLLRILIIRGGSCDHRGYRLFIGFRSFLFLKLLDHHRRGFLLNLVAQSGSRLLNLLHSLHPDIFELIEGRFEGQVITVLKVKKHESDGLLQ